MTRARYSGGALVSVAPSVSEMRRYSGFAIAASGPYVSTTPGVSGAATWALVRISPSSRMIDPEPA